MRIAALRFDQGCPRGARTMLLALAALAGGWTAFGSAQESAESGPDEPQRLRRVEWPDEPQVQSPVPPLAPDVALLWSERALDELVQAALQDPSLAAYVRSHAQGQDESAWTWRMARRELDRSSRVTLQRQTANDPFQDLLRPILPGPDTSLDPWMRSLDPFFGWDPFSGSGAPQPFKPLIQFQVPDPSAFQGKSVRVSRTPEGVRVVIAEQGPDGLEQREFEGESMEALREAHPELRGLLGDSSSGMGLGDILPQRLGWGGGNSVAPGAAQPMRTDRLGVWCEAVEPGTEAAEGGVRVRDIVPLSLAQVLGLKPGDILVELLGQPLREVDDISKALSGREPGAEIQAKWISEGRIQSGSWRPGPEASNR